MSKRDYEWHCELMAKEKLLLILTVSIVNRTLGRENTKQLYRFYTAGTWEMFKCCAGDFYRCRRSSRWRNRFNWKPKKKRLFCLLPLILVWQRGDTPCCDISLSGIISLLMARFKTGALRWTDFRSVLGNFSSKIIF